LRDILEMLRLQQRLNDSTNGENWEYGVTKSGKVIDWNRCIYMEVAELINSYPWKTLERYRMPSRLLEKYLRFEISPTYWHLW